MKIKIFGLIFLLGNSLILFGQYETPVQGNFDKMRKQAQKVPSKITEDVEALTTFLIAPAADDYEAIAGIYHWVTNNIQYDKAAYKSGFYRLNKTNTDILKRRKAICFGYAKLLEEMCYHAGIESYLISGYAKGTHSSSDDLEEINHAWNAVKLKGKWYLIDATWAAGSRREDDSFSATYGDNYFCSHPTTFLKTHFPAHQIWQLLDCPIDIKAFKKGVISTKNKENCINFEDSIRTFRQLSWYEQRIKTMEFAYFENPTPKNKRELAQVYMDLEGELSDKVEKLQGEEFRDSLFVLQQQMLELCRKASDLTTLYDNQIENCAYTYMNQGVAISRKSKVKKIDLEMMLQYFQNAKQFLESLSPSMFIEQGIEQCDTYIEYTKSSLGDY